ncbi:MAG: hypothetical protein JNN08_03200 [Bryobacterales bacterium]|nr:hypothetical protein [Bryobacterales bacterium]
MHRLLLFAAVAAFGASPQIPDILKQLSAITGLEIRKPVVQHTMQRNELKAYFEKRIKEVTKPEEIRLEELALKKLGFVPPEYDLKQSTIELMAEQAAAFYDYRAKKMVLLADGGGLSEEMALVHELSHALADQHFRLEKFLEKAAGSDDGSLARMAVMEGQATWIMSEFVARRTGQSLKDSDSTVEMMANMASSGGSGFPVFEKAPLYMRESLVFPYSQGMRFQHQIIRELGQQAFTEVFRQAPETTQEILHPEIYLERRKSASARPTNPDLPALPKPKSWKRITDGTSGEFDHQIWLKQYDKENQSLAASWRGGFYALWERKSDKRVALAYASRWDSEESAQRFFQSYRKVLEGKSRDFVVETAATNQLKGTNSDGRFVVELDRDRVTAIEGL